MALGKLITSVVPIAAKAIEYEPKALRQRAELIEKTDLGSEELLQAATDIDLFVEKFRGLFDSCDVDHSGLMGLEEFFLCIKAVEMELTDDEIEAYWSSIKNLDSHSDDVTDPRGEITFNSAVKFLRENIRGMERKKQNRQLARSLHTSNYMLNMAEDQVKKKEEELTLKLTKLSSSAMRATQDFHHCGTPYPVLT